MPEAKPGDVIREVLEQLAPEPDADMDRIFGRDKAQAALTALDELEAERDVLKHAAALVENPEYVAALQQAGVEYVEQLVARIAELEAALRDIIGKTGDYPNDRVAVLRQHLSEIERIARAAQPDTEGEQNIARVWKRVADDAHERIAELEAALREIANAPTYDNDAGEYCFVEDTRDVARAALPDTEGEQD